MGGPGPAHVWGKRTDLPVGHGRHGHSLHDSGRRTWCDVHAEEP